VRRSGAEFVVKSCTRLMSMKEKRHVSRKAIMALRFEKSERTQRSGAKAVEPPG